MTQRFGAQRGEHPPGSKAYAAPITRAAPSGPANLLHLFDKPVQQARNDCTVHAGVFLARAVRRRDGQADFLPSRSYLWRMQQALMSLRGHEASVKEHGFGTLTDVASSFLTNGTLDERLWPYDGGHYLKDPPREINELASKHRAVDVSWLDIARVGDGYDLNAMRAALDHEEPFAFGIALYTKHLSGLVATPTKDVRASYGTPDGHAVICYGYTGPIFHCLNTSWLGDGLFDLDESYMGDAGLTYNGLVIHGFHD